MTVENLGSTVVLHLPAQGPRLATGQDALDVIGETWGSGATLVAVPAERFAPSFFDLRTGQAGEFLQKLVNYRLGLAVVGDISGYVARSQALGDFVRESNRGSHVWFLAGREQLADRLAAVAAEQ